MCRCRWRLIADGLFWRCTEEFGVEVVALLLMWLVFFHLDAVCVGVGIVANARNLPGNFHLWLISANAELVVADLGGHDGLGEPADHGELIAEIAVEGFKILATLSLPCRVYR